MIVDISNEKKRYDTEADVGELAERIASQGGEVTGVNVSENSFSPVATPPTEAVVQAALAAAGTKGGTGSSTTSDWAHLAHLPAVKAGPGDTFRSHRPDEWLALGELRAGAAFYTKLIQTYAQLARQENHHG